MWKLTTLLFFLIVVIAIANCRSLLGYSSEEFGDSSEERYYPRYGGKDFLDL